MNTASNYEQYVLGNYGKPACTLTKGEGVYVWDETGRRFIDFSTGIAVNALGHCHPKWTAKISEQAAKLGHVSNLFSHEGQGLLAQKLVQQAGPGKVFFCNSGAEANEALLKLARLHGKKKTGQEGKCYTVLSAENAFHGRTFGGMAATPQEKVQGGFRPMLDGFAYGQLNDLASFEALIDESTAAIFIETVQGEGGIHTATTEFLQGIQALCQKHDLLFIIDEVQCGIGRTGHFYAFEKSGVQPDAIGMAKGLGGGFPIGAIWIKEGASDLFTPGSHGSTFGGNPLACAAALAVIEVIEEESLLQSVTELSANWFEELNSMQAAFPNLITEIRGQGFMIGLALSTDPLPIVKALREAGLLTVPAGGQVIRLLPPLNVTSAELAEATQILKQVFAQQAQNINA